MSEAFDAWDYLIVALFFVSVFVTGILIDNTTSKFCFCLEPEGHCSTSKVSVESQGVYNIRDSFEQLRLKYDEKKGNKIKRSCDSFERFDAEQTQVLFEKDFIEAPKPLGVDTACYCLNENTCVLADQVSDRSEFFEWFRQMVSTGSIEPGRCENIEGFTDQTEIVMGVN